MISKCLFQGDGSLDCIVLLKTPYILPLSYMQDKISWFTAIFVIIERKVYFTSFFLNYVFTIKMVINILGQPGAPYFLYQ